MPEKGFLHKIAIPTRDGETITSSAIAAPYILLFNVNNRSYQLVQKIKRTVDENELSEIILNAKADTIFLTGEDEIEVRGCQPVHYPAGKAISDALFEFIQELN